MTSLEKFLVLVANDHIQKANVIILLQGDGFSRISQAVDLLKNKWAERILFSGNAFNLKYGSYPAKEILDKLIKEGVNKNSVIHEDKSKNTKEAAEEAMKLIKKNSWKKILLVASHYHQYRAFLTFLKAMKNSKLEIIIINTPARDLPWFLDEGWGRRIDLLKQEFERIEKYRELGHVASYEEALEYFAWKEKQI